MSFVRRRLAGVAGECLDECKGLLSSWGVLQPGRADSWGWERKAIPAMAVREELVSPACPVLDNVGLAWHVYWCASHSVTKSS